LLLLLTTLYAISTLMYVAQIEPVPEYVAAEERVQVLKMFPGPGTWVIPSDLWFSKENFGMARSAQVPGALSQGCQAQGSHFGLPLWYKKGYPPEVAETGRGQHLP
jgi:hypothetical protein